ncbi:hypothetical protein C9374_011745 [Naegleria lovaniensis]|uniref:Ras family small GTPase n=1 Tax=Naegleria lovaniensis TaxID=51637 RepID=A0AA88G9B0_NAELO|nr:uncharacterized protein C9374_011745 [Naegleria lovaniensis]KAG2373860.1 hypothetical protein C9374_011745 [Naegleria lovaniensis]
MFQQLQGLLQTSSQNEMLASKTFHHDVALEKDEETFQESNNKSDAEYQVLSSSFKDLPFEIIYECISYLHDIEIVFRISNICSVWRYEIAWPILHAKCLVWLSSVDFPLQEQPCTRKIMNFEELFQTSVGMNCLRFMMRDYVAQAVHLLLNKNVIEIEEMRTYQLDSNSLSCLLPDLKYYFSKFATPPSLLPFINREAIARSYAPLKKPEEKTSFLKQLLVPKKRKTLGDIPVQYTFKSLLFGKQKQGKHSLFHAMMSRKVTSGANDQLLEFGVRYLKFGDEFSIRGEFFSGMHQTMLYHTANPFQSLHILFICFDVTKRKSFQEIEKAVSLLRQFNMRHVEVIVLGTKCDLKDQAAVKRQEVEQVLIQSKLFDGAYYIETSCHDFKSANFVMWYANMLTYCIYQFTSRKHNNSIYSVAGAVSDSSLSSYSKFSD